MTRIISKWLTEWMITINSGKPVAILFRDKKSDDIKPILINDVEIKWSNSVKYLGVKLDSKLRFSQHNNRTKVRFIRVALYPMLNHQNKIPLKVKLSIIKIYIITILTYAGPVWGALISEHLWQKLEVVQNIALRTAPGLPTPHI